MKGNVMTLSEAVKSCFCKYITISGRAGRAEFWWFALVFGLLAYLSAFVLYNSVVLNGESIPLWGWILFLAALVSIPPYVSVIVRRLHDGNHSGHYVWIAYLVLAIAGYLYSMNAGASEMMHYVIVFVIVAVALLNVVLLWWVIKPGDKGGNKFGAVPKK
ncbi:MAG: DUF805 domain-containing protein [Alphaproteobacteria bacterium]